MERKEKERRELEEERKKEDVQQRERLQEDNVDIMLLPSYLDWLCNVLFFELFNHNHFY